MVDVNGVAWWIQRPRDFTRLWTKLTAHGIVNDKQIVHCTFISIMDDLLNIIIMKIFVINERCRKLTRFNMEF